MMWRLFRKLPDIFLVPTIITQVYLLASEWVIVKMAADVKKVKPIDYMNVQLILCQFNLKGTRQFSGKPACCRPNHFRIVTWNKAPWKGTRIPVSVKVLPVESRILGFGIRNTAQGIQNSCNDWNPESNFHWQRLESSWIQNCLGFPYMGRYKIKVTRLYKMK